MYTQHVHACCGIMLVQVPKDNVDEFKSIKKFKVFNTNNLWVSLRAIKRLLDEETMRVEVIANRKVRGWGQGREVTEERGNVLWVQQHVNQHIGQPT